jgi:hypothetical protein
MGAQKSCKMCVNLTLNLRPTLTLILTQTLSLPWPSLLLHENPNPNPGHHSCSMETQFVLPLIEFFFSSPFHAPAAIHLSTWRFPVPSLLPPPLHI